MHMKCRQYRADLLEAARGGKMSVEARDHLRQCAACERFYEDQAALTAAMQGLAAGAPAPGAVVEARVLKALDGSRVPAWRWAMAAMVAAGACLGAWWALQNTPVPDATQMADNRPFLNIPYTVPLAPEESAVVWRERIPVSQLIAAGFHVQVSDPSAVVEADVLVSQDGRARAIRPVSISMTN
jgi:hypothetical protein